MGLSQLQLVICKEEELGDAARFIAKHHCGHMYVTPEIVSSAAVARTMIGASYKMHVMVNYPKGNKYGQDKFAGTRTEFFLVDGYDIVLTPGCDHGMIMKEVESLKKFVLQMISPVSELSFTINQSVRTPEEIEWCAKAFFANPPTRIKLEAQTKIQPTKATVEVHSETIKAIREHCQSPIVVCGNVNYKIYSELQDKVDGFAVSLYQANRIVESIEEAKSKDNE